MSHEVKTNVLLWKVSAEQRARSIFSMGAEQASYLVVAPNPSRALKMAKEAHAERMHGKNIVSSDGSLNLSEEPEVQFTTIVLITDDLLVHNNTQILP